MCYCPTPTLHLNLALTGDGAFLFSLKKTHSVWFISVLNYGDTENVLINHLLLVIPVSYPCHYTNLCPHKPHKHAHTHTHTHKYYAFFCVCLRLLADFLLFECQKGRQNDVLRETAKFTDRNVFKKLSLLETHTIIRRLWTKIVKTGSEFNHERETLT